MTNLDKIEYLQKIISNTLVPLINSDYVLLDIPNHGNIGDQLIYEGEHIFLEKCITNYKCMYSANCDDCDYDKIPKDSVILLHGGGNFGDIYSKHQKFRLDILRNFPNQRVIILPQTVFYNDNLRLEADVKVLEKHSDLFICVRDTKSKDLLSPFIDEERLFLLPDMAFFIDLSPFFKNKRNPQKVLLMHRIDIENITSKPSEKLIIELKEKGYIFEIKDWPTFYNTFNIRLYNLGNRLRNNFFKFLFKLSILPKYIKNDTNNKMLKTFYLKMGIKFMNKYDIVYTTRLHGLILALLLNKDVVVLDNSYGKLSSFYETWLMDFNNIRK